MDEPTGEAAGNALEVAEAVRCIKGGGPADLEAIVIDLCAAVSISSREQLIEMLHSGKAWEKFQRMVAAQGGDVSALERMGEIHRAPVIHEVKARTSGRITQMDARAIGQAVLELGAGRAKASDNIDYAVGCDQIAKSGRQISAGETLIRIHARSKTAAEAAEVMIRQGICVQ
jgi:thymidine phosphorylase